MYVLGIDLQQVSIASLIIALALEDVPGSSASDRARNGARTQELDAAWFDRQRNHHDDGATLTNIVLPALPDVNGTRAFSFAHVITCSLIAANVCDDVRSPDQPHLPTHRRSHGATTPPDMQVDKDRVVGYRSSKAQPSPLSVVVVGFCFRN
jgi:hypothetical protein